MIKLWSGPVDTKRKVGFNVLSEPTACGTLHMRTREGVETRLASERRGEDSDSDQDHSTLTLS